MLNLSQSVRELPPATMEDSMLLAKCSQEVVVQTEWGGVELVDRIAEQWRELCMEGPSNEPFYRPEWIAAYLRAFASGDRLVLITASIDGRLKGLLPLLERRVLFYGIPLKKLQGAANVHSCRFDLVRGAGPEGDAAVLAIWNFLKSFTGWDLVELPDVPQGGSAEQLLWMAQKDGFLTGQWETIRSPYIVLTGQASKESVTLPSGDDAHFRQNLRRRLRKAMAIKAMRLRRVDRADANILQRFYELESSGWKGKKGTAIASDENTRKFYDEIACAAEYFGYLSLYFIEFNNSMAAGHFGLTYGGRYYSIKVAYDENEKEYGPGHLLVSSILQDCPKHGVSEFDFLGPWMEWKAQWTAQARPHAFCYIFRKGLLGRTLCAATHQGFKMTKVLKRAAHSRTFAAFRSYLSKRNSALLPGRQ